MACCVFTALIKLRAGGCANPPALAKARELGEEVADEITRVLTDEA